MPPVLTLKTMTDRLSKLGSRLILSANMDGKMNIGVETNAVNVSICFKNLAHPDLDLSATPQDVALLRDPTAFASVTVDMRHFIKFIACHSAQPRDVVCCACS
jgi:hypothetical protein